jgi:hypothetical protein
MYLSQRAEPRRSTHITSPIIPVIEIQFDGVDPGVTGHSTYMIAREVRPAFNAAQRTDNHGPAIAASQTPTIHFPEARY